MKTNPLVSTLSLFNSDGNPACLEYLPYPAEVKRYDGYGELKAALTKSDMVIITGHPRKPGMTRDEFAINAGVVKYLCEAISVHCPKALVNMINNDVNSIVPIAAEVFKKAGTYDPKRLFGVTTSNVVRAQALYAKKAGIDKEVLVPVVGGHDGITILPLFSQATLQANLSEEDVKFLTSTTQSGGTEFVRKGSATLSMAAVAGAIFADACLKGLNGAPDIVECTYVQSDVTDLPFFGSKVRLGKNGVEEIMGLGSLSDYEKASLENLLPELKQSIDKGIEFVKKL